MSKYVHLFLNCDLNMIKIFNSSWVFWKNEQRVLGRTDVDVSSCQTVKFCLSVKQMTDL